MSLEPLPISVSIITHNEEKNLPRLFESLQGIAAEIVIVDSGSTDRTREIAEAYQARFAFAPWQGFIQQKNHSLELCTQPWVLFLDADEALSPELVLSIQELFSGEKSPIEDAYWINRRTWYLGAWIWHAWYPEWRLRLLRRGRAKWGGRDPHAALEFEGTSARLRGDLLHYSFEDLQDHLLRTIGYARVMANSYLAEGRKVHWHNLLLSPIGAFFKHLVLKQGWRDGWRGWIISIVRGFDCFSKYAFLVENKLSKKTKSNK